MEKQAANLTQAQNFYNEHIAKKPGTDFKIGRTRRFPRMPAVEFRCYQPKGEKAKAAIFFNHGFLAHPDMDMYHQLFQNLAERGYAVYVHTLPGHGSSGLMRNESFNYDQSVAESEAIIRHILTHEKVPVFITGHSAGAAIAADGFFGTLQKATADKRKEIAGRTTLTLLSPAPDMMNLPLAKVAGSVAPFVARHWGNEAAFRALSTVSGITSVAMAGPSKRESEFIKWLGMKKNFIGLGGSGMLFVRDISTLDEIKKIPNMPKLVEKIKALSPKTRITFIRHSKSQLLDTVPAYENAPAIIRKELERTVGADEKRLKDAVTNFEEWPYRHLVDARFAKEYAEKLDQLLMDRR